MFNNQRNPLLADRQANIDTVFDSCAPTALCKYVLGASCKSCNDAVRGELGRYPVLLMTMNQWFKYAKHCYSLPCYNFSRASLSGLCDYTTCSPYRNWSSKIYDVISSVYCGFDVVFNENALHHPALPLYVQEHSMLKYQRAWLSSINKGYNPNKPNKIKCMPLSKNHSH